MDCKLSQTRAALFVYTYRVRYVSVNFNYLGAVSTLKQLPRHPLNSLQRVLAKQSPHPSLMTHPSGLWKSFAFAHIYSFLHTSKNTVLTSSLCFATHSAPVTESLSRRRAEDLLCQDGTLTFLLPPFSVKISPPEEGREERGKWEENLWD